MNKLKEQLEQDIKDHTKICGKLNINSSEYMYWNGCRCQAQTTLNLINNLNK